MLSRGWSVLVAVGLFLDLLLPLLAAAQPEAQGEGLQTKPAVESPEPVLPSITLGEAVSLAQRNAPAVVQAEGNERTAGAAVRAAYGAFVPNLSLSYGANRQFTTGARTRIVDGQVITLPDEPWSYSAGWGANVELFDGGRRFFDLRQANARKSAAEVDGVAQQYSVALTAKQQYFNVLAARESQVAARAQLEQAEQQRRTSIARTRARDATRSDSLRAEIQVRDAQLAFAQARNDIETANASLTRTVGSPHLITAAADLPAPTPLTLAPEELATLADNGPLVQEASHLYTAARAATKAAWTDYLPSVNLSYSRNGSGASQDFAPATDLSYNGAARLSLSLPVFNQFQREQQLVQSQVAKDNAEAGLRDARLAARETLTQWLGAFHVAEEQVAAQSATIQAAEEDLRVQQQRYAVGASTLLDVLTSQTQLDQARRDLIRARYDQRVAKAQLEALVGRDL